MPEIVTTTEELDSLPKGAILRQIDREGGWYKGDWWVQFGTFAVRPVLPAVVIYKPEVQCYECGWIGLHESSCPASTGEADTDA